ncbi:MAG: Nramp family divalent metal transporter [Pirellulaceae bacterium]|nr:Nramp family divalent metal transporter [Pirellulaceae bacterium]
MTTPATFEAPHPGTKAMPRWDTGELIDAPIFTWRNALAMIGPGLVMGASAIGGGEWLAGPAVTAKYGGALLWVATVSILFQVVYNIEISRYTLYTGEPIFTGKFRLWPHPMFWLVLYLMLDWGSIAPYLAVNAAVTVDTAILQRLPDIKHSFSDWLLHKVVCTSLYLLIMIPLVFGGKIYNSLKVVMSIKLIVVIGFLMFLGILFASFSNWIEIVTGLFKVGTLPVASESGYRTENIFVELFQNGRWPDIDFALFGVIAGLASIAGNGGLTNTPISNFTRDQGWGMGHKVGAIPSVFGGHGITLSHVGCVFQVNDESLPRWKRWYRHIVRDQLCVWLVACLIGVSLPSILSVGFLPRGTDVGDNAAAATAGGVQERVTNPPPGVLVTMTGLYQWLSGPSLGRFFWGATLFCGFLVLLTSQTTTMDGFVRRWVDVIWTASARLRQLETSRIRDVYFTVLCIYAALGLVIIWSFDSPLGVFKLSTTFYNVALGCSCWHTIFVNTILLPREIRPAWHMRILLGLAGCYFLLLAVLTSLQFIGIIK